MIKVGVRCSEVYCFERSKSSLTVSNFNVLCLLSESVQKQNTAILCKVL